MGHPKLAEHLAGEVQEGEGLAIPLDIQLQAQLRTRWFALNLRVDVMDSQFSETLLVDSRLQPSRIAARRWGE